MRQDSFYAKPASPYRSAAERTYEWLVSVRDVREASMVTGFGVDILDLKEPSEGSLAPVCAEIWKEIVDWVSLGPQTDSHIRLSAALGESQQAMSIARHLPAEFTFAKAGPSQIRCESEMVDFWSAVRSELHASVELVAVAYADDELASSLKAESILELAARSGLRRILIDTFDKDRGSAIDLWGTRRLGEFARLAQKHQLWWSLAGSINLNQVSTLASLFADSDSRPDCLAVRGDLCDQDRAGSIHGDRLHAWANVLNHCR